MLAKISIGAVFAEAWTMFRRRFVSILALAMMQNLWCALALVSGFRPSPWMETTGGVLLLLGTGFAAFLIASMAILFVTEGRQRLSTRRIAGRLLPAFMATSLCFGLLALACYAVVAIVDHLQVDNRMMVSIFAALLMLLILIVLSSFLLVTLPACVLEGLGPLRSIGRSIALGRGQRWRLIAILLILAAWSLGVDFIAARLARGLSQHYGIILDYVLLPTLCLVWFLLFTPLTMVICAAHRLLLRARDGIGVEELALVFE